MLKLCCFRKVLGDKDNVQPWLIPVGCFVKLLCQIFIMSQPVSFVKACDRYGGPADMDLVHQLGLNPVPSHKIREMVATEIHVKLLDWG